MTQPAGGLSRGWTLVAFAAVIGIALLSGGWIGAVSREETWEQNLYTQFFVKVAAGVYVVLGVSLLFVRGRRVLGVALLTAAALFWSAFLACSGAEPRDTPRRAFAAASNASAGSCGAKLSWRSRGGVAT